VSDFKTNYEKEKNSSIKVYHFDVLYVLRLGDYSVLRSLSDDLGPGIGAQSKPSVLVLVAGSRQP
jgi:hypothetical protein